MALLTFSLVGLQCVFSFLFLSLSGWDLALCKSSRLADQLIRVQLGYLEGGFG
jgi:hypothetical protein